ncbi:uncharacterized protein LOC124865679 isoform X2 [Girardinichthys multiradiatus]|uniref:uncharacterized protein LOC124865679 isoform X2 n=1 Tax=Girardinichthys multiradiatus TaxID=208333 RepID=UPI001FADE89A|nr:uncharacterized protein LOC124865679 isoform X2 [Girardinichthys multiradiatus]
MKGFMFCLLLLPFAVMAVQGQIRAQRRHVLIFLNEGLGATTERATPAKVTDLSEMQSAESFVTTGYPGPDQSGSESKETSKDNDSYEVIDPKAGVKGHVTSRRKTRVGTDNMQLLNRTSRLVQDSSSQEQIKAQVKLQESGGQTDLDREDGMIMRSGRATQSTRLRLQAERADPDKARETSWKSSKSNNGKPAVGRNSEGKTSYCTKPENTSALKLLIPAVYLLLSILDEELLPFDASEATMS